MSFATGWRGTDTIMKENYNRFKNFTNKEISMKNLLEKLAKEGGKIVSSASCSQLEIAQAQACDRMYIDEQGLGFIHFPERKNEEDDAPRRIKLNLNEPAELAIYNSIQEVEKMPASPKLTEAVILLGKAKDLVGDFIDGIL